MRIFTLLAVVVTWSVVHPANGDPADSDTAVKHRLRVLYVGPHPTKLPRVPSYVTNADRMIELIQERPAAFKRFLETHFQNVRIERAEDYDATMSNEVDVTIFDAQPDPVEEREVNGFPKRFRLPADFDRPALMVGEVGPFVLGRFGFDLKIDHL